MSDHWIDVLAVESVPEADVTAVYADGKEIALYEVEGEIFATDNLCTHGAARMSDDYGSADGWAGLLTLLAALNVSVGVFNMFPLLPLDGGHAAIAVYERLRERGGRRHFADVSRLMPLVTITVALLAFMFFTGLYLDTVAG